MRRSDVCRGYLELNLCLINRHRSLMNTKSSEKSVVGLGPLFSYHHHVSHALYARVQDKHRLIQACGS